MAPPSGSPKAVTQKESSLKARGVQPACGTCMAMTEATNVYLSVIHIQDHYRRPEWHWDQQNRMSPGTLWNPGAQIGIKKANGITEQSPWWRSMLLAVLLPACITAQNLSAFPTACKQHENASLWHSKIPPINTHAQMFMCIHTHTCVCAHTGTYTFNTSACNWLLVPKYTSCILAFSLWALIFAVSQAEILFPLSLIADNLLILQGPSWVPHSWGTLLYTLIWNESFVSQTFQSAAHTLLLNLP